MSAPNETTPLKDAWKDAKASANEQLQDLKAKGAKGYAEEQIADIGEEGFNDYLGSFICCRTLAPVQFSALQQNRQQVLRVTHWLCAISVLLSVIAYWGGFAHTDTLSRLSWITVHGPQGTAYAGVRWICYDLPSEPPEGTFGDRVSGTYKTSEGSYWRCETWAEFDCATSPAGEAACSLCKVQAHGIVFSVMLAGYTAYSFYKTTGQRLDGDDSNWTKFSACNAALIGGTNFLLAMLSYWKSCVLSAHESDLHVHTGVGLVCILIAAVLKVPMGLVHLGLPVEKSQDVNV